MNELIKRITGNARKNAVPNSVNRIIKSLIFSLAVFNVSLIPNRKYTNIPSLKNTTAQPAYPLY